MTSCSHSFDIVANSLQRCIHCGLITYRDVIFTVGGQYIERYKDQLIGFAFKEGTFFEYPKLTFEEGLFEQVGDIGYFEDWE